MAAATVTKRRDPGSCFPPVIADIVPSTSYPALGEPIQQFFAALGLRGPVYHVDCSIPGGSKVAVFDPTVGDGAIRLYTMSTGAEVGTGSDQSGVTVRCVFYGPRS